MKVENIEGVRKPRRGECFAVVRLCGNMSQRQQKGGGDRRLYSESMSKLDSAKMIIDAGSLDNIACTEMVGQLGLGKLKQDVWCEVVPMYYISYSEDLLFLGICCLSSRLNPKVSKGIKPNFFR